MDDWRGLDLGGSIVLLNGKDVLGGLEIAVGCYRRQVLRGDEKVGVQIQI